MREHMENPGPVSGRSWPTLLVVGVCTAMITAVISLFVMGALGTPDSGPAAQSALPPPTADVELQTKPSPSQSAAKKRQGDPIQRWCWGSRNAAETAKCQEAVARTTKFVPRYVTHQAALAKTHPVVKRGPEGREANSLARHGLLICWMTQNEKVSFEQMVSAFTFAMHPHPYKLPPVPGVPLGQEARFAATQIHMDALQTICPSQIDDYGDKGGPVIRELAE